jgi:hypothetical protein
MPPGRSQRDDVIEASSLSSSPGAAGALPSGAGRVRRDPALSLSESYERRLEVVCRIGS